MYHHKSAKAATVSAVATFEEQLSFRNLGSLYAQNPNLAQDKTPTAPIYPEAAGYKAEGTSQEAAQRVSKYSAAFRKNVLDKLAEFPQGLTADELGIALGLTPFSVRPRVSELKRLGDVVATGERRKNESGMSATVWRVADAAPWQNRGTAA